MTKQLPANPSIDSLKYEAKQLLKRHRAVDQTICDQFRRLPRLTKFSNEQLLATPMKLADAQHTVAANYGFSSWAELKLNLGGKSLSDAELFERRGLVKKSGLIATSEASELRRLIEQVLERSGVCEGGRWSLPILQTPEDYLEVQSPLQKKLKQSTAKQITRLNLPEISKFAEKIAGEPLFNMVEKPQLLFTPPNAERWYIPSKVWHVDSPRFGDGLCPGVQMFTFIDQVDVGGGGTVVAAGSHRFINDQGFVRSKKIKQKLKAAHPWFKSLFHPNGTNRESFLDQATAVDDIELQVEELTGKPGDVYFMDLRLFHSLAPNVTKRPRLMVTQRYYSKAAGERLFGMQVDLNN